LFYFLNVELTISFLNFNAQEKPIVMKTLILISFVLVAVFQLQAQTNNPVYDSALAEKLGGDDYGMKSYMLVILKTGSNKTTDKPFIDSCFRGHMENIGRMVDANKLIVAGPLGKNENSYRGIFILNVKTVEEANSLLESDPAVKENLLAAEIYKWYGSAALPQYLPDSDKIWKVKP
jgi:uncharacterized protein YciI